MLATFLTESLAGLGNVRHACESAISVESKVSFERILHLHHFKKEKVQPCLHQAQSKGQCRNYALLVQSTSNLSVAQPLSLSS